MSEKEEEVKSFKGDSEVGKTNIITNFMSEKFHPEKEPTIAVSFYRAKVIRNDETYWMHIWDTGGQEKFESVTSIYYRGANGAIIVFDLANKESFDNARRWYNKLKEQVDDPNEPPCNVMLVGNKCDLEKNAVEKGEIAKLVNDVKAISYFNVSAKSGDNIIDAFHTLLDEMIKTDAVKIKPKNSVHSEYVKKSNVADEPFECSDLISNACSLL